MMTLYRVHRRLPARRCPWFATAWFRAAVALFVLLPAHFVQAEDFGLILTISDYQRTRLGDISLPGVKHDRAAARKIAQGLGVPAANIQEYTDSELTLAGLRAALAGLLARVKTDDRVFLYYSGHGQRVPGESPGTCSEVLLAHDNGILSDRELDHFFYELQRKVDKVVFFMDACHSGGTVTRNEEFQAKSPPPMPGSPPDVCESIANISGLRGEVESESKRGNPGGHNALFIAAARDNEVSLTEAKDGSLATQAWVQCLSRNSTDADGSGGMSADEVAACAQKIVTARIEASRAANRTSYLPHHIEVIGNRDYVVGFPKKVIVAESASGVPSSAINALRDIYARRDDRRRVSFAAKKREFRIGKDNLEFSISSSHPGYVYILAVGSDTTTWVQLFPNELDQRNYIEAKRTLELPRSNLWQLASLGPPGTNQLLAVVATSPRDFKKVLLTKVGDFYTGKASSETTSDLILRSAASSDGGCGSSEQVRNFEVQAAGCGKQNVYGAALMQVKEVN